jgi:hypothetical protein
MITPSPGEAMSSAPLQAASGMMVLSRRSERKLDIAGPPLRKRIVPDSCRAPLLGGVP